MSEFGIPTDEQLAKINSLAKRTLSKDEVFTFPSKLAGDMIIPNRYIQLQKSLLDVYANDAKKGVSLLLDHSWSPDGFFGLGGRPKAAIPYGRTFDSKYETSTEEGETISLVADHYMLKGVEIDGIKTDDLAISIEAGTLFDTSIGFGFDKATCSVCNENYRRCDHYAGRTYEIEDDDGVTRQKFCYIKAEPPGYLMENSLVFDGAYPGAGVLSNVGDIAENENGIFEVVDDLKNIDPDKRILSTYSNHRGMITMVKKSDHKKVYATGGFIESGQIIGGKLDSDDVVIMGGNGEKIILKGSEKNMDEKSLKALEALGIEYVEGETTLEDLFNQLGEKWDATVQTIKDSVEPLQVGEGDDDGQEFLGIPVSEIAEKLGEGVTADDLLRLAKEGQEYHKTLSDEAIAMGVRAMGNDFPKETWEKSFTNMDTKAIKDIMATWEMQAKVEIPAGRKTDIAAGQDKKVSRPDEAYKVGK